MFSLCSHFSLWQDFWSLLVSIKHKGGSWLAPMSCSATACSLFVSPIASLFLKTPQHYFSRKPHWWSHRWWALESQIFFSAGRYLRRYSCLLKNITSLSTSLNTVYSQLTWWQVSHSDKHSNTKGKLTWVHILTEPTVESYMQRERVIEDWNRKRQTAACWHRENKRKLYTEWWRAAENGLSLLYVTSPPQRGKSALYHLTSM